MDPTKRVIDPASYRRIVVLTGAGISVASGLRPYRGEGGTWGSDEANANGIDVRRLDDDPDSVWQVLGPLRTAAAIASPNAGHHALVTAAECCPGSFVVVTQNVDGLHQRAGQPDVIEMHGSVHRTRCVGCALAPYRDATGATTTPTCGDCGAVLRPDVVLFGEAIPASLEHRTKRLLRDVDLFIAVGTSGAVSPASGFARSAAYVGARTILVNAEPPSPPNPYFGEVFVGRAEVLLPRLFGLAAR